MAWSIQRESSSLTDAVELTVGHMPRRFGVFGALVDDVRGLGGRERPMGLMSIALLHG
jgi:hypothetical protein